MHLILFSLIFWVTHQCYSAEEVIKHYFHAAPRTNSVKKKTGIREFLFVHYTQKEVESDEWQFIEAGSGMWDQVSSYLTSHETEEMSGPINITATDMLSVILGKIYYSARTKSGSWQIAQHEVYKPLSKESLHTSLLDAYKQSTFFLTKKDKEENEDAAFIQKLLAIEGARALFNTVIFRKEFQL